MVKKIILDCENELWEAVLKYKIESNLKNNNQAVIKLLEDGLDFKKDFKKQFMEALDDFGFRVEIKRILDIDN